MPALVHNLEPSDSHLKTPKKEIVRLKANTCKRQTLSTASPAQLTSTYWATHHIHEASNRDEESREVTRYNASVVTDAELETDKHEQERHTSSYDQKSLETFSPWRQEQHG